MTVTSQSLERAVRRYWFRNPQFDGVPMGRLPIETQRSIAREAVQIQKEDAAMSVAWGK